MFAFSKNNYDLCSRPLHNAVSDGAKSPRYRYNRDLLRPVVSERCDSMCPKALCNGQDLSIYCTHQLCPLLKKLASHCHNHIRTSVRSSRPRPTFNWPQNLSTPKEPSFPRLHPETNGGISWTNAPAIPGSYMTRRADIHVCCLSTRTSKTKKP